MSVRTARLNSSKKLSFDFRISLIVLLYLVGCGAPGEPVPPSPVIPAAVTDLKAFQAGDGVQLSFALPRKSVGGEHLDEPPAVEILRGIALPDGKPDPKSFHVVGNIPGVLAESFVSTGRMQYFDPLSPAETEAHPGASFVYRVRTRVSRKRASADSNIEVLRVFPVAERISRLEVRVTETAVELRWQIPVRTSGGHALAGVTTYAVYRGELDPSSSEAAGSDVTKAVWKAPFQKIGISENNDYRDTAFDFGRTYLYVVRSITRAENAPIESADSVPSIVTPRDVFPPAPPQDVVAASLPGATAGSVSVELSWSIGIATDLAGYRVYRSEEEGARGNLLTQELLLTPAYRDNSVAIGHHYWYTITAVDRSNNESLPGVSSVQVVAPSL
ncbi:MAG: hypothetical protein NVS9B13_15310 [Candidatus Acidiferrum sp.]